MLQGKIYDCMDQELFDRRVLAGKLCIEYNNLPEDHKDRPTILRKLFPHSDESLLMRGPIYVDYGENIYFGKNVYANFNFVVLDVCPVHIGDHCFFGPNVSILTALHSLVARKAKTFTTRSRSIRTLLRRSRLTMPKHLLLPLDSLLLIRIGASALFPAALVIMVLMVASM